MPYRHELCVLIKDSKSITSLNIHKRWKVEYFDTAQLDEISDSESERGEEDLEDLEKDQDDQNVDDNEEHEEDSRRDDVEEVKEEDEEKINEENSENNLEEEVN